MIRALETAMSGYVARAEEVNRVAKRVASSGADGDLARDLVDLKVNQRGAEASLLVARVADEMGESLIHVIA
jgi:hypothetical protein